MKGYLINMKSRPDRLQNFKNNVEKYLPDINIELVEAADGKSLDLNDIELKKNINEWNFKYLNDKCLRGIVGCCLSHLKCYKKMIDENIDKAIIFEDDCIFRNDSYKNIILNETIIPEDCGIIWINYWENTDYCNIKPSKYPNMSYLPNTAPTTEAYIITNKFAKILYNNIHNDIGAIDVMIKQTFNKFSELNPYILKDPPFKQNNRSDSDIR